MGEMLKKLDPTQLFKLEQPADKCFEEFYESFGTTNISKDQTPNFIYELIHREFDIPEPEEEVKQPSITEGQAKLLAVKVEDVLAKKGYIDKDELLEILKTTFSEESMMNFLREQAAALADGDGRILYEDFIKAVMP